MHSSEVDVYLEYTPNPNTLKYTVNRTLLERGAANFLDLNDAQKRSPLAALLLGIPGIEGVMIGRDFVTITKAEDGDWEEVHHSASQSIRDFLVAGNPLFTSDFQLSGASGDSEIEKKIVEILEEQIRPAVAQDGGDITFERYEDGVVYVSMQGACSGCPSSTMTLKMGIERRLQQFIPEIKEVVSV